jgi:hypothetical protein
MCEARAFTGRPAKGGLAVRLNGAVAIGVVMLCSLTALGADRKFYEDDPLQREPATQDASKAEPWEIDLFWDLTANLFARLGDSAQNVRAQNVNTVDEVPDSTWFTNRILARPVSVEEAARGPLESDGPGKTRWIVTRAKEAGTAPGFTARDDRGTLWFVSFDAKGYPEAATGAILVANKIFWTLGYWQAENYLTSIRPEDVVLADTAAVTPPSGRRRPMRRSDIDEVFARAHRGADGAYRAIASRAIPGKILGGFKYHGTRPDDPNDVVPHEHRRELRALKVFGAWTNLVDMKAGNTLDTVIEQGGRGVVHHYLQDVGSTFGTGSLAPREWDEGWEYLYEGDKLWKRLLTFGLFLQPWQTADYRDVPAIGRFEAEAFDPVTWKPRVPTAAFLRARPDDDFWAARRVMAFTDEMIRAIALTGSFSDPAAAEHLSDVLAKRRDKLGRAYLPAVNPLVDFVLADNVLTFANAAVEAGVATEPKGGYVASWASFDNDTGRLTPIGGETPASSSPRIQAPPGLPSTGGVYVRVQVSTVDPAHPAWAAPVDVYFRRAGAQWKLVGLERLP